MPSSVNTFTISVFILLYAVNVSCNVIQIDLQNARRKMIQCDKTPLQNAKITELILTRDTKLLLTIVNEIIPELCENSFDKMRSVSSVNFTSNKIRSLKPGCFNGLIDLYVLDLSDNELQEIKNGVFNELPKLRDLVLSNNAIEEIGSRAFGSMPNLRTLKLDDNNIVILGNDWFRHTLNLRHLNLAHNRITAIGPRIFDTLRVSSKCQIKQNDNTTELLSNDTDLLSNDTDLLSNDTDMLSNDTDLLSNDTDMLSNVTDLLSNVTDVTAECGQGDNLFVDLSYNELISVHPDAFKDITFLGHVSLRHNKLISLIWSEFGVGTVDLRDNPLRIDTKDLPENIRHN